MNKKKIKKNLPLVSIGVPAYNAGPYLEKLLDSLLGQTYTNLEIIISNNCSKDNTKIICKKYVKRDSRIKYIERTKFYSAINNQMKVFDNSKGDYFMMAGADDFYDKKWIFSLLQLAIKKNSPAFGKVQYIDSQGKLQNSVANHKILKFIGSDYSRLVKFVYTPSIYGKMILFWSLFPRLKLKKIIKKSFKKKWGSRVDEVYVFNILKRFDLYNSDRVKFYKRNHNKSHSYTSKKNNSNNFNSDKSSTIKKILNFFKAVFLINNFFLYFKLATINIKILLIIIFPIGYIYHIVKSFFSLIFYKFKKIT